VPSLIAYVIALCLLLTGGYGALSWLAAPEPANVVVKKATFKRQAQAMRTETPKVGAIGGNLDAKIAELTLHPAEGDRLIPTTNRSVLAELERGVAEDNQPAQFNTGSALSSMQSTNRDVLAREVGRGREKANRSFSHSKKTARLESPSRQSHRSDHRKLVVMTLRTIEFADGRRATKLIPYRGEHRVMAFGPNE